jgi:translocation and assembly module TamA
LGRLVYAVAASAALCLPAESGSAAPRATVQGEIDSALKAEIAAAIGDTDRPIENRFEARRRARAAAEDAEAVLRSEGYYANQIEPSVGEGDAPAAIVHVTPGKRFMIAGPAIAWTGAAPDDQTAAAARNALGLRPGQPGRAADVVSAEGRVVAATQKRGYADAAAEPREVVVDHADYTVQPTYHIAVGKVVKLDGLQLVTNGRTRLPWLQKLAPWRSGQTYDPEMVAELERRLLDVGVYESVTVALAPIDKTTPDGLRPVVVSLAERKRHTIELGGSYGTEEGYGLDAKWTRYNVLGRADTLALSARLSNIDSRAGVTVTLPHWRKPDWTLTGNAQAYHTTTDAYDENGVGIGADVRRRYSKTSYLTFGATVDLSQTKEPSVTDLTILGRDLIRFGTLADLTLDRSDDPLDPKRGWRFSVRAEPTVILGDENLPYVRLISQGSVYYPFGPQARTVLAGRVRVGGIVNGGIPQIPASQRFYAGGGGSVRGFSYQGVGPQLSDGTPQGGASLVELSAEVRQKLAGKWGVVAFVDAGAVGTDQFPGADNLAIGAGFGVRYDLGFGPIRFDIATPVTKRDGNAAFQIYVSIGQSF